MSDDNRNDEPRNDGPRDEQQHEPTRETGRDDNRDRGDRDTDDHLGDAGKKALEAERRARRAEEKARRDAEKTAQELADKVAEYERAQMSDQERTAAERDDWRKQYENLKADLAKKDLEIMRRDVAAEMGLNPGLARRLQGSTREELEDDANKFLADVRGSLPAEPMLPRNPRPDPSQGSGHESRGGRPTSVAEAMREMRARDNGGSNPIK